MSAVMSAPYYVFILRYYNILRSATMRYTTLIRNLYLEYALLFLNVSILLHKAIQFIKINWMNEIDMSTPKDIIPRILI